MMRWDKLLNSNRFRSSRMVGGDGRTQFERDYDRLVFCSSIRRLQDKAQVFPLEKSDFVRTRLTHSLEVASLGRSLGIDIARKLKSSGKIDKEIDADIGTILSSVCLVHDIGNPPFGHFGETIIQSWFNNWLKNNSEGLTEVEKLDFKCFEGNAQSFRILTRLQFLNDEYGINLTFATLASLMKYPCASNEVIKNNVTRKKFGYFQSEKSLFERIRDEVYLNSARHPVAFILEAADDIAYSAADIEDAVKKNVINIGELISDLKNSLNDRHKELIGELEKNYLSIKDSVPDSHCIAMQNFRIKIQGLMLRACVDSFLENYNHIMEGTFDKSLIESSSESHLYEALTKIAIKRIYCHKEVLQLEVAGNRIITGLLESFISAVLSDNYTNLKTEQGKLYALISPNFRYVKEKWTPDNKYTQLQLVTDFICGMTDSYALDLYQKIYGVKIL